jgi:UDP-N-acetylglucosamine 2-epimerase
MTIKLLQIVGARPQFVKVAPLSRAIAEHNSGDGIEVEDCIVHTGQHYDKGMSDIFFQELNIPQVKYNLGVGSASHGEQTAAMLSGIEKIILETNPGAVVIYGDTNSTIAGALAAVKLHVPVVHIEAGLRSFNRHMPEEINRVAADHISDLLLAPTPTAVENLRREGLADRTIQTGDIMFDAVLYNRDLAIKRAKILKTLNLENERFSLVTLHRAENTDNPVKLSSILDALNRLAQENHKLILPLHPRTGAAIGKHLPDWRAVDGLRLIDPLGYLDMLCLLEHADLVLTDSGGLQKEAFFLQKPCLTLRDETEWVETVAAGGNQVVGSNPAAIYRAAKLVFDEGNKLEYDHSAFGHGDAAKEILHSILDFIAGQKHLN